MRVLRYLCFFPSINFGLLTAEVFPYAFLYGAFSIRKLNLTVIAILGTLGCSAVYTLISANVAGEVIRSLMAYLNPLLIFAALLQISHSHFEKFQRTALTVFKVLCVLLVIQVSGLFGFLDPVFKALVPRSFATSLGFRGVTLLATEPARAAVEFLFVYVIARFALIPAHGRTLADIALGLVLLVAFRAASGILVYGVFLLLFNRKLLLLGVPFGIYVILTSGGWENGRVVTLIVQLSQLSWAEGWFLLINTSGNRLASIISATTYGFTNPLGGGVGNWQETSVTALKMTGIDYSQLNYFNAEWKEGTLYFRASGYMMNLLLDVGFVGFAIMSAAIYRLVHPFISDDRSGNARRMFLLFVFNIMIVGSVGVPVAWIATAIFIRSMAQNPRTSIGT